MNDYNKKERDKSRLHAPKTIHVDKYGVWKCICGNTGDAYGFYPCDTKGRMVE